MFYDQFMYFKAFQALLNFVTNDVSALYFDVIKDRLYADSRDSPSRRAAQTVLAQLLSTITRVSAPIVCHTAEDIFEHSRAIMGHANSTSVFELGWMKKVR